MYNFIITCTDADTTTTRILKCLETKEKAVNYLNSYLEQNKDVNIIHNLDVTGVKEYKKTHGYLVNGKNLVKVYQVHDYKDNKESKSGESEYIYIEDSKKSK